MPPRGRNDEDDDRIWYGQDGLVHSDQERAIASEAAYEEAQGREPCQDDRFSDEDKGSDDK